MLVVHITVVLFLLGWQPLQADAGGQQALQNNHIRLGVVQDTSLDNYCGVNLKFSKDFRKNNRKYAFMISYIEEKKAVMHLDGRDVYLQLKAWTTQKNTEKQTVSERLSLQNNNYSVEIKWLVTDICDKKHNEDCEIEGLRAYVSIYRKNRSDGSRSEKNRSDNISIRHARLLGFKGC